MPWTSRRKQKYNLFKRWFISSIYNRIPQIIGPGPPLFAQVTINKYYSPLSNPPVEDS